MWVIIRDPMGKHEYLGPISTTDVWVKNLFQASSYSKELGVIIVKKLRTKYPGTKFSLISP